MSLIQSISRGALQFRADVTGAPAPWDDFWYGPLSNSLSASGMRVSADSAKRIAAVLACVGIIGRNVAMMPVKIYTDLPNGGKKPVPQHPVYGLLATRPNQQQTAFEFYQMMQGHLELRGNAYAQILDGPRGAVDQLVPLHPDRVKVERLASGKNRYKYNNPLTGNTDVFVQEEVFHLKNWSDDGIVGQSTVAMGVDVFGAALAQQDYSQRFFANDSRPGGLIEGANFRTNEDKDKFVASWEASQSGKNRHKVALLPLGLTYKEIGVKPSDAQLLDARKFSRIEICSIFGVPPHLIGETEKTATYASVEQFNIMFAVQCLLPRIILWEQAIQRDLILSDKYYPKFSVAGLLRGDVTSRTAAYQIAIQNGWMSQNDVRELEDMNPIEGGDTYWRPLNWAPLTQVADTSAETDDEPGTDEGNVSDSDAPGNSGRGARARLQLLASSAADRIVRKELAAVSKLRERNASEGEFERFRAEHADFVSDVLKIPVDAARAYTAENLPDHMRVTRLIELATEGVAA